MSEKRFTPNVERMAICAEMWKRKTDKEILACILCREHPDRLQAQRALYEKYTGLVVAVIRRYTEQDTEDIGQKTWLRIFTRIDQLKSHEDRSVKAWIGDTAASVAMDEIRVKRASMRQCTEAFAQDPSAQDLISRSWPNPEQATHTKRLYDTLARGVADLPAQAKLSTEIMGLAEGDYEDVARLRGKSIGLSSAGTSFYSGRQKLKKYLQDLGIGENDISL